MKDSVSVSSLGEEALKLKVKVNGFIVNVIHRHLRKELSAVAVLN